MLSIGDASNGDEHSLKKAGGMGDSTSHADEQGSKFSGTMSNYDDRKSSRNSFATSSISGGDTIDFSQAHGLQTGDAVIFNNPTFNDPNLNEIDGLKHGKTYYVIKVDDDSIKLAATADDAKAMSSIALDATGADRRNA